MPLEYGEGKPSAMMRLRKAVEGSGFRALYKA